MRTLFFDPSGNFDEGKGTTGWAIYENGKLEEFGDIKASDFGDQEQYWQFHAQLIKYKEVNKVVLESYKLFSHKAQSQSWSAMETPQLIGFLRMFCWGKGIECDMQNPADKKRVADDQLVKLGVFEKKGNKHTCMGLSTNLHMRDAIRHGFYYYRFGRGKNETSREPNLS